MIYTSRTQARVGKWTVNVVYWAGTAWVGVMIISPYLYYRNARYNGPPFITKWDGVDNSLVQSRTVKEHINPLGNKYWGDTRSITFNSLRDRQSGKVLSDAEILKRLCLGLWGGTAFSYEQAILRGIPRDRVHFAMEKKKDRGNMFATERIGQQYFEMEKGDHLHGTFQILDMKIRPPGQEKVSLPSPPKDQTGQYGAEVDGGGQEPSSYIDFGYGSSRPGSTFAGVHRFSVTRLPPEVVDGSSWQSQRQKEWLEDEGSRVKVAFESYTCSPTQGAGWMINDWTWRLHKIYAGMLFSTGVSAVVRGWGRSRGS